MGRPKLIPNPTLAKFRKVILERLEAGESLLKICETEGFPTDAAVRRWAVEDVEGFASEYTRARSIGYEKLADEILRIADTPIVGVKTKTNEKGEIETTEADMIEHRRLQVDTRKWMLSKMLPKRFGDKVQQEVSGPDGGPVQIDATLSPSEAYKRMIGK